MMSILLRRIFGTIVRPGRGCRHSFVAVAVALAATTLTASASEPKAELSAFSRDGQTFYSLNLTAPEIAASNGPRDVVVLFDTSASQTGAYREMALAALDECIAKLQPSDRVRIMAVDLEARSLAEQFLSANSPELKAALVALRRESPLGSTDMEQVLQTAAQQFDAAKPGGRVLLYIGDGDSKANLLGTDAFRNVVRSLTAAKISLNSYAIGPECDTRLLAALANHTGGNLYVAGTLAAADKSQGITAERAEQENLRSAAQVGDLLAAWSHAIVIFPEASAWPQQLGDVFPQLLPPLRSDRDTVVVGAVKGELPETIDLASRASDGQGTVELKWTAHPNAVGADHSYLAADCRNGPPRRRSDAADCRQRRLSRSRTRRTCGDRPINGYRRNCRGDGGRFRRCRCRQCRARARSGQRQSPNGSAGGSKATGVRHSGRARIRGAQRCRCRSIRAGRRPTTSRRPASHRVSADL